MQVLAAAAQEESAAEGVYAFDAQPLEEGVRKHTLSVFVADESGLINRVAGVFARRGANIESLAVGLTLDKALFTIVANGTDATINNLCKQLGKLVNVQHVENITDANHVERELVLIKVAAKPGTQARLEIMEIAEIFRTRIVDVAEDSLTMSVTGDPGKIAAFAKVLGKFGIIELVRTGRIALKRGADVFQDDLRNYDNAAVAAVAAGNDANGATADTSGSALKSVHDVFGGESDDGEGVWSVKNVLDAAYNPAAHHNIEPFTLSIDVEDVPGVLNQVTGVFARRGFNVQSLAVGNSEKEGMSRITTVVPADEVSVDKIIKQLYKLVYVRQVTNLHNKPHVNRELMLIKVSCTPAQRGELSSLADIFHGHVVDVSLNTVTIEVTGKEKKMKALKDVLSPYGILEVARTGRVALARESGVDTGHLRKMRSGQIML